MAAAPARAAPKRARQADAEEAPLQLFAPARSPAASVAAPAPKLRATVVEEGGASADDQLVTFESLGVPGWLCQACRQLGIHRPTAIQRVCIPAIARGENVVGRAKTGSGKTAAFALPMLHKLSEDPFGTFALVLTPTRELALQMASQFRAFGVGMGLTDVVAVGGLDMSAQCAALEQRPHVVIATPGRLADILRSGTRVHFQHLQFLVLDEADRLFEPCFAADVETILSSLPPATRRQTLLFSATLTQSLAELQARALGSSKPPLFLEVASSEVATVEQLRQHYLFIPFAVKECYLIHLLKQRQPPEASVIIFTATCRTCQIVAELLLVMEIPCVSLHSRLNQARRMASLGKFQGGVSNILVATDVASRGLDIPSVQMVINFDVPRVPEDYIHRVGRTARAGRGGMAVTLVSQHDIALVQHIEGAIGTKLSELPLQAKEAQILEQLKDVSAAKRMAKVHLEEYEAKNPRPKKREERVKR